MSSWEGAFCLLFAVCPPPGFGGAPKLTLGGLLRQPMHTAAGLGWAPRRWSPSRFATTNSSATEEVIHRALDRILAANLTIVAPAGTANELSSELPLPQTLACTCMHAACMLTHMMGRCRASGSVLGLMAPQYALLWAQAPATM